MKNPLVAVLLAQVNAARAACGLSPLDTAGIQEPSRKRPDGPPNRSREEKRRLKQMARQEVKRLAAQSEASAGAATDWEGGGA